MRITTRLFLLAALLFSLAGCRSAETRIVYSRTTEANPSANGFMKVATEDEIPVTVAGHEDAFDRRSISGFYVIAEEDLVRFVENTERLRQIRAGARAKGVDLKPLEAAGRSDE